LPGVKSDRAGGNWRGACARRPGGAGPARAGRRHTKRLAGEVCGRHRPGTMGRVRAGPPSASGSGGPVEGTAWPPSGWQVNTNGMRYGRGYAPQAGTAALPTLFFS